MASDTLRVLHLPPHLSDERREELFKKYGAVKTKTVRRSDNYSATFVKFPSRQEATEAFLQLHQLEIKGQFLSVEFAKKSVSNTLEEENVDERAESTDDSVKKETADTRHFQAFLKKLNGWANNDLLQPPPPNIWYKYSAPTRDTLLRIAIQLIKEPAFYTQVLHLMNKMNLPPPFEELEEEFPLLREAYEMEKYKDILGRISSGSNEKIFPEEEEEESEESEIESDGENKANPLANIPLKRKKPQSSKRLKIPKFVNPAKQNVATSSLNKPIRPEEMFESVERGESRPRKIELKPVEKLDMEIRISETNTNLTPEIEGGFGLMFPTKKDDKENTETENEEPKDCITAEELEENRISEHDQRLLPVYKNYHAGKPSCRLYIKNLARQVEENDLYYIYRRFVKTNSKDTENQLLVRLMQEGRMKGQAFVTFPNEGQAIKALLETNGYILKDKPMVVQYAKAAKE